jgi:hypothetical protein
MDGWNQKIISYKAAKNIYRILKFKEHKFLYDPKDDPTVHKSHHPQGFSSWLFEDPGSVDP